MTSLGTEPPGFAALELRSVDAGYADTTILRQVDVAVTRGSVTALVGTNGAGKTTLLKVAAGLLKVSAGEVLIDGVDVRNERPSARARAGICFIPEGRGIFPRLSVRENLLLQIPPWDRRRSPDEALEIFPALKGRLNAQAGSLSGGQQQILALCRCYLASPRVILLDEVSTGLAPQIVDQIFESLHNLARDGIAMLLVEQYVTRALEIADQVILLNRGCVVFTKKPSDIDRAALVSDYLGSSEVIKADSGTPSMLHT